MFYIHILGLFVIFFDWIIKCWSISSGVHFLGGPRPNTLWHCWTQANFVLEQGNLTVPAGHSVGREWPWKLFKILMANPLLTLFVAPTAKIWNAKKIKIIWTFIFTVMTFWSLFMVFCFLSFDFLMDIETLSGLYSFHLELFLAVWKFWDSKFHQFEIYDLISISKFWTSWRWDDPGVGIHSVIMNQYIRIPSTVQNENKSKRRNVLNWTLRRKLNYKNSRKS